MLEVTNPVILTNLTGEGFLLCFGFSFCTTNLKLTQKMCRCEDTLSDDSLPPVNSHSK